MGYCPPHVRAARARGDHNAVVAYASAGGRATAEKYARERAIAEAAHMRLDEEMRKRAVEANECITSEGDILPLNHEEMLHERG